MFIHIIILIFIIPSMILMLGIILYRKKTIDKILATNSFATSSTITIVLLASLPGKESYIDIAIIYGLLSFASIVGLMKFFGKE